MCLFCRLGSITHDLSKPEGVSCNLGEKEGPCVLLPGHRAQDACQEPGARVLSGDCAAPCPLQAAPCHTPVAVHPCCDRRIEGSATLLAVHECYQQLRGHVAQLGAVECPAAEEAACPWDEHVLCKVLLRHTDGEPGVWALDGPPQLQQRDVIVARLLFVPHVHVDTLHPDGQGVRACSAGACFHTDISV